MELEENIMDIKNNPKNTAVFADMLESQSKAAQLKTCSDHLAWDESKRFYEPLAHIDIIFS